MKEILKKKQLKIIYIYPKEIVEKISETVQTLDENYGASRNINDLGGYILIAENIVDIEMLKADILKDTIAEYTDIIKCSGEVNYTSSLFLLSSDYAIVVVTTEELSKFLLD